MNGNYQSLPLLTRILAVQAPPLVEIYHLGLDYKVGTIPHESYP